VLEVLTAIYDGQEVGITDYESPKLVLDKSKLKCKFCNQPLTIRHGLIRAKHFAHFPEQACDFEKLQGEPESFEHRSLKAHMKQYFEEQGYQVELEKPMPGRKRIADLFVTSPKGYQDVVECQLANITAEKVLERTRDYESFGHDVLWVFNKPLVTENFIATLAAAGIPEYCTVEIFLEQGNFIVG
jgi:competence CoiA-like predicted nuclease